jgi:hypothetical protein
MQPEEWASAEAWHFLPILNRSILTSLWRECWDFKERLGHTLDSFFGLMYRVNQKLITEQRSGRSKMQSIHFCKYGFVIC